MRLYTGGDAFKVYTGNEGQTREIKSPKIIEFYVKNLRLGTIETFKAYEGITWEKWIIQNYGVNNYDKFWVNYYGTIIYKIDYLSPQVLSSDIIIENYTYTYVSGGPAEPT